MDDYLSRQRRPVKVKKTKSFHREGEKKGEGFSLFAMFRRKIPSDEEVEAKIQKKEQEEELEQMEEEIKEIDEVEEELEEEREGIISRFLRLLRFTKSDDDYEEVIEATNEDSETTEQVKDVIKILHKWLEQLPPEKLTAFKQSEDFAKYKQALKDLKLIKQEE